MNRILALMAGVAMLSFAGGCSQYVAEYQFVPRPAVSEIPGAASQPAVTALASVVGVLRADDKQGLPDSVEVRLRVENNGPGTIEVDPHSLELTNGELQSFPAPVVQPPQPMSLAPQQSAAVVAYFPFPAGRSYATTDLATLQLRWTVRIDGRTVRQGASFGRAYPVYYYDPYYGYPGYPWYGPRRAFVFHGDIDRRRR